MNKFYNSNPVLANYTFRANSIKDSREMWKGVRNFINEAKRSGLRKKHKIFGTIILWTNRLTFVGFPITLKSIG